MAAAKGIGALVPGIGNQTEQSVLANSQQPLDQATQTCGPVTLPSDFPAIDLATACSDATAAVENLLPRSNANASVASIDVNGNQVLGPAATPVNQPIGGLLTGLQPVFNAVNQTGIDANSLLDQIISAITQDGNLGASRSGRRTPNPRPTPRSSPPAPVRGEAPSSCSRATRSAWRRSPRSTSAHPATRSTSIAPPARPPCRSTRRWCA